LLSNTAYSALVFGRLTRGGVTYVTGLGSATNTTGLCNKMRE